MFYNQWNGVPWWQIVLVWLGISCCILVPVFLVLNWQKLVGWVTKLFYSLWVDYRKEKYLPPRIKIEGYGIKRDLTLIEAAVLMRKPVDQILGRILVDASAKNVIRVSSRQPIRFEIGKPLPKTLTTYERDFVRACRENMPKVRTKKFAELMIKLVKTSSEKIRGFSLTETKRYFQTRVDIALDQLNKEDIELIKSMIGRMSLFLAQITKTTNPYRSAPRYKESGSWDGGGCAGGGRGSACACAGCACACACAGCACACAGGGR